MEAADSSPTERIISEFTAAPCYAAYRPGIPEAAVRLLSQTVSGKPHPALPDLGSGTGQRSAFSHLEVHTVDVDRPWTPQTVIGYLYSTSFASRPLFGDRLEEFELRALTLLTDHADAAA
ncbi:hypothetical protein [Streptomyces sp. NPDC020298]|uniref:hypothetical protein n=1 Tax=Streptomyces sp. NPDC020298 TaxID=3155010 RepID=UPI0033C2D9BF